jgi:hypothetical protein
MTILAPRHSGLWRDQKARRGELFMTVAIGYVRVGHNRIEKDPDRRVAEAIELVFAKFAEMHSVRQVHLWFREERIPLPAVTYAAEGRMIEWKLPVYNTILHNLTNPISDLLSSGGSVEGKLGPANRSSHQKSGRALTSGITDFSKRCHVEILERRV